MNQDYPNFVGMFFIFTVASALLGWIPAVIAEDYRRWKGNRRARRT